MAEERFRDLLKRLSEERLEADRRYNQALTALDRAIQTVPPLPSSPPPYDEQLLTPINERRNILPDGPPPMPGGWRGRLAAFVWGLVEPALRRQIGFNAALVDHLNRNVAAHREAQRALDELVRLLGGELARLAAFESLLLQFLQHMTPYVDTKDREVAGGIRAANDAIAEVRAIAEVAQRAAVMAKRELERLASGAVAPAAAEPAVAPAALPASARAANAYKYVGFEDRFRGSEDEIRERLADYVPYFAGASDVLDVGCGRGEFLELLKQAGVRARGLDLNHEMVEVCRARGLDVAEGDALSDVSGLAEGSLGGFFAAQVAEHLEPAYLLELLEKACFALRPGSAIVLETINPACWVAFFECYIRDVTHVRPLHPETLRFLLHASGFTQVEIVFRSPVPESAKLQGVTPIPPPDWDVDGRAKAHPLFELVQTFNLNVERLNQRLFTHLEYAAIARRP